MKMKIGNSQEYFSSLNKEIKEQIEDMSGGIEKLLNQESTFQISSNRENSSCYNREENRILLTPYDAFTLRKQLNIPSTQFAEKYGKIILGSNSEYPLMILNNEYFDENNDICTFLRQDGCSVYKSRPLVCRMFPLGRIADKEGSSYFFLTKTDSCCKSGEGKEHQLESWLKETKTDEYIDWSDRFHSLVSEIDLEKYKKKADSFKWFLGDILYNYDKIKNSPAKQLLDRITVHPSEKEIDKIYTYARSLLNVIHHTD